MRILVLLLLLFNCFSGYPQQCQKVDSLFKIFKADVLFEQAENFEALIFDSDTKVSYYTFLENSSVQDLLEYVSDENAVVRAYIFVELLRKGINDSIVSQILDKHKDDTTTFTIKSGCVIREWTVIKYMKFAAKKKETNRLNPIDYKAEIRKLNSEVRIKIKGVKHNIIDKNSFLGIDCLELNHEDLEIFSFSLFLGELELKSNSCKLTKEMLSAIKKVEQKHKITIANIEVMAKDGKIRRLKPVELVIR